MAWDKLGDMKKATYDTDDDGVVDEAAALESGAQADADKIQGVDVDDAAKADQKVLTFVSASGNIEYITPAPSGAAIDNIQYGTIAITGEAVSNTATINAVVLANSVLILFGLTTAGKSDKYASVRVVLTNTTTVTAVRATGAADQDLTVGFCVIEFSSGIETVQHELLTVPSGNTTADATISSVSTSKSVILNCGHYTDSPWDNYYRFSPRFELINATTVRATTKLTVAATYTAFSVLEFS